MDPVLEELGRVAASLEFGAPKVLACSFASGVVFILVVGLYNLPAPYIAIPILGAGAAMIGSQLGANAMAAGLYPARIRSTARPTAAS